MDMFAGSKKCDFVMSMIQQVLCGQLGAATVVAHHDVGGKPWVTVDEHHWCSSLDLAFEKFRWPVGGGSDGDDEQPVDPAAGECLDQFVVTLGLFERGSAQDQATMRSSNGFERSVDCSHKRVGNVGVYDPDCR